MKEEYEEGINHHSDRHGNIADDRIGRNGGS
jgi:hypothetical protein